MSAAGRRPRSVPVTLWLLAAIFLVGTPATPQIDPGGDGDSSPRVRRLAGVAAEAAALVFSGRDGGEIPTFAWAAPLVPASGLTPVPFVLEIEGARLLGPQVPGTQVPGAQVPGAQVPGAGPGNSLTVEVHAYALDEAGRTRGHPGWSFTLDVDAVGESLFAAGIRFHGSLELPPAGYQLRFLVREPESGRYGLRSLEVRVPAVAVAEPLVLPPVVRGARSGWIEVRSAAVVPDGPIAAAAEPPQALPMLPIAGTAAAELWVYRLPAAEPTLEARLLSLETGAESAIEATICSRGPTGLPGLERLDLALALPELAVGNYRLTLTVVGEAGLRLAAPPLPVYLLTSDLLAAVPAWVSLGRLTEQATTAAPGRPTGRVAGQPVRSAPAEAPAGSKKGAIERRYRWALADLVAGELDAAIAALAELEEATLAVPTASKEPPLARAELAVARSLGKREPESLLALADLHLELDARYGEKGSLAAARHSRWMAENLAVEYATRVDTPAARRSAAEILALLGLEAQEAQLSAASRR